MWVVMLLCVLWFVGMVVFSEDGLLDQYQRRVCKPQPMVALVCDMLSVDNGWSFSPHADNLVHETHVSVERHHSFSYIGLTVDGIPVQLSQADKFRLYRACLGLHERAKVRRDEAAAMILAQRAQAFAAKAQRFADTVVPFEKRA